MNNLHLIFFRIIQEQELVVGPLAWELASKVSGLKILDKEKKELVLEVDEKTAVNELVAKFTILFGEASREACKLAVRDLLVEMPKDQVPSSLL